MFENAVKSKIMSLAQIGFVYQNSQLKGQRLKRILFWVKIVFLTKNHRFLKFSQGAFQTYKTGISIIKTVLQLNEPVRGEEWQNWVG